MLYLSGSLLWPMALECKLVWPHFLQFRSSQLTNCLSTTVTMPFSNTTTAAPKTSSGSGAPVCCFVVQDTVSEEYWQQYTTTTQYSVVNLTSITTLITPYPSVTSTNYETNVYTTNAYFIGTQDSGYNPIYLYKNAVPGPVETVGVLNGSQTVTAGITM